MGALAKEERENFLHVPEAPEPLLKSLFELLLMLNHHPLVVRIFPNLFPEEEKEKIPCYEPLEIERITLGMLKELKRIYTDLKNTTEDITRIFNLNQENLKWLDSNFRRKIQGEWAFGRRVIKEIELILNEVQNEFKK